MRGADRGSSHLTLVGIALVIVVVHQVTPSAVDENLAVGVALVVMGHVAVASLMRWIDRERGRPHRRTLARSAARSYAAVVLPVSALLLVAPLFGPWAAGRSSRTMASAAVLGVSNDEVLRRPSVVDPDRVIVASLFEHMWAVSLVLQVVAGISLLVFIVTWGCDGRVGRRRATGAVCAVGVLSGLIALSIASGRSGLVPYPAPLSTVERLWAPSRVWQGCLGALVACAPRGWHLSWRPSWRRTLGFVSVAAAPLIHTWASGSGTAVAVAGAALVLHADEPSAFDPVRTWSRLRTCLWLYVAAPGCVALAVATWSDSRPARLAGVVVGGLGAAFGIVVWRAVERRLGDRSEFALVALVALIVCASFVSARLDGRVTAWNRVATVRVDGSRSPMAQACSAPLRLSDRDLSACTWGTGARTIVVVGDSNAAHLAEGLRATADELDATVVLVAQNGCSFVAVQIRSSPTRMAECRSFVDGTVQDLVEMRPDLVVVSNATDLFLESGRYRIVGRDRSPVVGDPHDAWQVGLVEVLQPLRQAGIGLVVVHSMPKLDDWSLVECSAARLAWRPDSCSAAEDLSVVDAERGRSVALEAAAALDVGATTLDLAPALCPSGTCTARRDGVWWWRNGDHLSPHGSEAVADLLTQELGRRMRDG